jgi:hypothetical protein
MYRISFSKNCTLVLLSYKMIVPLFNYGCRKRRLIDYHFNRIADGGDGLTTCYVSNFKTECLLDLKGICNINILDTRRHYYLVRSKQLQGLCYGF